MKSKRKRGKAKYVFLILLLLFIWHMVYSTGEIDMDSISTKMEIGDSQTYYVLENRRFYDNIIQLDANGDMQEYFKWWNLSISDSVVDIYYDGELYFVDRLVVGDYKHYVIYELSDDMEEAMQIAEIIVSSKESYKDIAVEDGLISLLTISQSITQLNVYQYDLNDTEPMTTVETVEAAEGEFFVECEYSEGEIYVLKNTGGLAVVDESMNLSDLDKDYLIAGIRQGDDGILVYDSTNNSVKQVVSGQTDEVVIQECNSLYSIAVEGADRLVIYLDEVGDKEIEIGSEPEMVTTYSIKLNTDYILHYILKFYIVVVAGIAFALFVFLGLRRIFMKSSDFSAKLIIMMSVVIIPMVVIMQIIVYNMNANNLEEEFNERTSLYANVLAETLTSLNYSNLDITTFVEGDTYLEIRSCFDNMYEIEEEVANYVVYLDDDSNYVLVSDNMVYGTYMEATFEDVVIQAVSESQDQGKEVNGYYELEKDTASYSVIPIDGKMVPNVFLVSLVSGELLQKDQVSIVKNIVIFGGLLVLIQMIVSYIWISFIVQPVKILSFNMEKVTRGDYDIKEAFVRNDEFGKMWVSLKQMVKVLELRKQIDNSVVEKYYQFTQKDIEKYFGKESITELGERERTISEGMVGFIYSQNQQDTELEQMNVLLDKIEGFETEHSKILLPGIGDMSVVEMAYPGIDAKQLKELYHTLHSSLVNEVIFADYSEYEFGVTNIAKRYYTYLKAQRMQTVQLYRKGFLEMGVRVIFSEEANKVCEGEMTTRYIGYVFDEIQNAKIQIYELLLPQYVEADIEKHKTTEQLQQALQLYYDRMYYEARELFYEILKRNTSDGVAAWYVNKCNVCMQSTEEMALGLFQK